MLQAANFVGLGNAAINGRRLLLLPAERQVRCGHTLLTPLAHRAQVASATIHRPLDVMFIIDAIIAFVLLGVTEAFVKPMAIAFVQRSTKRFLPAIFQRLDKAMPELLSTATPEVMTAEIASAIADATGKPATARQIDQVVALYNPIKAALRNVTN